jgi:hypothetical protein
MKAMAIAVALVLGTAPSATANAQPVSTVV